MPSERPFDRPGLSAPEELSLPLSKDRDLRDPVDDVDGNEKIIDRFRSRTRMVSIKRPRRANFTAVDGSPPSRRQIFRITTFPGVGSLCRELLPGHKLTMPSERPFDRPGLSAPEELSLPLSKDRDLRDPVDDVDGNEKIIDRFRSRTRMVSIKRPRRANFTAVDGSPPSRRQIFRITTFPGVGSLCRELLPGHKLTMPSERPFDRPGLSAPEELSLPLSKDRDLRDPVDDVDGNEKIIDRFRSRTRMVSIKRPRRANFTAVDGSPPSRRQIFRITTFPGVGSLCRELLPGHKLTMPSERPFDRPGLSAPEELSLPLSKDRDLRDPVFSELPRATV
ncbi:hypothetical protein Cantr_02366 [Candida viswanathii]|uniref:Uncharacterized protein n=1 Tax=Candida viswanathii TaxID=5486 RepID=A0A367YNV1_9ASCO|nr:hypothetical protein Cantr_02366 [Candida viswanathii]